MVWGTKKAGRYPALLKVQGYSSNIWPDAGPDDFVVFSLNIRGHGTSRDDINPGFPGYLQSGIESKEKYIYRGAYMDCIRAVDFLCSRPEVDTSKIAVEGGSQGGALSFATAALDRRIKACVPMIPFLSDFPTYFKVGKWPANEFEKYVKLHPEIGWATVYNTLSYIDIKNLATMITCPMMMVVGLQDEVCPPHINFAAYNNVRSPKQFYVYPDQGHSLGESFYKLEWKFLREQLQVKSTK